MTSWDEVEAAAPELAGRARAAFDAHKHKLLATLRRDGSPRISGIEATFADGELWLGMMPGSRKALDLRRDPRLPVLAADKPAWADLFLCALCCLYALAWSYRHVRARSPMAGSLAAGHRSADCADNLCAFRLGRNVCIDRELPLKS